MAWALSHAMNQWARPAMHHYRVARYKWITELYQDGGHIQPAQDTAWACASTFIEPPFSRMHIVHRLVSIHSFVHNFPRPPSFGHVQYLLLLTIIVGRVSGLCPWRRTTLSIPLYVGYEMNGQWSRSLRVVFFSSLMFTRGVIKSLYEPWLKAT